VNDGGNKNARALTLGLDNEKIDDYGLEILVDDPGYAIHSSGTGTAYFKGKIGIGTASPQSALQVEGAPGYLQIDSNDGIPPDFDCGSNAERGRMILDFANNRLYVCTGSGGWKYAELK
jgi:hypothetical protein